MCLFNIESVSKYTLEFKRLLFSMNKSQLCLELIATVLLRFSFVHKIAELSHHTQIIHIHTYTVKQNAFEKLDVVFYKKKI